MRPYLRTCILESKEAAIEAAATTHNEVEVFSDGSSHDGQIGAAAVLCRTVIEKRAIRKHMGSKEHHTVFKSELFRISLAAEMIVAERHV